MKLRAGKWQTNADFIGVSVVDWQGRVRKRLLPREGWEELETEFFLLTSTAKWVRPLYLVRKRGEYRGYEGKELAENARREK